MPSAGRSIACSVMNKCSCAKEGKTAVKKESEIKVKVESKIEESVRPRTIASLSAADDGGPFPNFARPHEAECRKVTDFLIGLHGDPQRDWETAEEAQHLVHGSDMVRAPLSEKVTVLDSLVSTILSQNTTDKTSHKAFSSLKKSFPTWESVRTGKVLLCEWVTMSSLSLSLCG